MLYARVFSLFLLKFWIEASNPPRPVHTSGNNRRAQARYAPDWGAGIGVFGAKDGGGGAGGAGGAVGARGAGGAGGGAGGAGGGAALRLACEATGAVAATCLAGCDVVEGAERVREAHTKQRIGRWTHTAVDNLGRRRRSLGLLSFLRSSLPVPVNKL